MFIADIKRVIDQVSRDKGINREVLIKALEEALESAARKKLGTKVDIEVQYNDATGEIEVFQFKDVTEDITERDRRKVYFQRESRSLKNRIDVVIVSGHI